MYVCIHPDGNDYYIVTRRDKANIKDAGTERKYYSSQSEPHKICGILRNRPGKMAAVKKKKRGYFQVRRRHQEIVNK